MHPLIPHFGPIEFTIPVPVLGELHIHGFGLLVATGMLVGTWVAQRKAIRDGFDPELPNRLLGWVVVGVFVGGHLGDVLFYHPKDYLEHPLDILKVWSGISSFGGFFFTALLAWWFIKKNRLPFYPFADVVFYGLAAGWFFGRLGCFTAHDHPGIESNFWLAVYGICDDGDPTKACLDLGFLEALYALVMLIAFWILDKKPRFPGFFMGLMLVTYGPVRFFLDSFRTRDARYWGLTPAQYGSVVLFVLGVRVLWRQWGKTPYRLEQQARAAAAEGEGETSPAEG